MNTASTSGDREFFTPAELCARWKISPPTLDKLGLPWTQLSPRVRRIKAAIVITYEKAQRFEVQE